MFTQVLDTLLAVFFHLMGIISLSFLLLFPVCLLGFLFFQCPKDEFPRFFVKFPMNGCRKAPFCCYISWVLFMVVLNTTMVICK